MQTYSRVYTSQAPHVVGQEVLLEYAVDDFLRRTTRLKPWRKARYEALLQDLDGYLQELLKRPTPLTAFVTPLTENWLKQLTLEQQDVARTLLGEFETYLIEWAWLERKVVQA